MDTQSIIAELEAERNRLDKAIAALQGMRGKAAGNGRRGRRLSATAKRRISEGMKRKWAARKRTAA
jgi:hypothetical protein